MVNGNRPWLRCTSILVSGKLARVGNQTAKFVTYEASCRRVCRVSLDQRGRKPEADENTGKREGRDETADIK